MELLMIGTYVARSGSPTRRHATRSVLVMEYTDSYLYLRRLQHDAHIVMRKKRRARLARLTVYPALSMTELGKSLLAC